MNSTILIFCLASFVNLSIAIKCDFRYSVEDKNYPELVINSFVEQSFSINTNIDSAAEFYCDDDDDKGTSWQDFIKSRFEDSDEPSIPAFKDDDRDAESLCATMKKTIRPKALPSVTDNKLLTVVNHAQFSQTVTLEICTNENKPCQFDQNFPLGYATKCKQKYQMHTIKTLNAEKTAIIDDKIYFPAACDCKVFTTKSQKNRF